MHGLSHRFGLLCILRLVMAWALLLMMAPVPAQVANAAKAAVITQSAKAAKQLAVVKPVSVPNLRGKSCDEARVLLREHHLSLSSCQPGQTTGSYTEGLINGQTPEAGTPLKQTDGVVSATTEPAPTRRFKAVRVPPLVDQTVPQASSTLEKARLQAEFPTNENDDRHYVVRSEPPSGTAVQPGSAVHLVTEIRVRVPDIAGRSAADARSLIEKSGLNSVLDGPKAEDGVLARESQPPGGTLVALGTVVRVALELTVPDLAQLSCDEARVRAHRFGFDELQCQHQHQTQATPDRVFSQTPPAGSHYVAPVAVRVMLPLALVVVPDLLDRSPEDARAALEALKLKAQFESAEAARFGRVVDSQHPAAGKRVDEGTPVTLHTVALVAVPDVGGLACEAMRIEANRLGLQARCEVDAQRLSFSEPHVVGQQPAPGTLVKPGTALVGTLRASTPWGWIGGLAVLLVGLGSWTWRHWRRPQPNPVPAVPAPIIGLRAQADPAPALQLHWADPAPHLPGLALRSEAGTVEFNVVGLAALGDSDGQP